MDDDPDFVSKLLESFYVDDFVGGGASSEDVTDLYSKTSRRMLDGGFKLRKWTTNDISVRMHRRKLSGRRLRLICDRHYLVLEYLESLEN